LGVALDRAVTIPGAGVCNDRLEGDVIEIGLGIHGEAGLRQSTLMRCDELAEVMVGTIRDYGLLVRGDGVDDVVVPHFDKGDDLAVLVNNLGGTSNFEMSILANSVVKLLERTTTTTEEDGGGMNCTVPRLYVGSFMTAFNMHGASISILSLTNAPKEVRALLDAETTAPAWGKVDVWKVEDSGGVRPSSVEIPEVVMSSSGGDNNDGGVSSSSYAHIEVTLDNFSETARSAITAACHTLIESEPILTRYDTIVGDGDCGITMKRGATEILSRLEQQPLSLVDDEDDDDGIATITTTTTSRKTIDTSHPVPLFGTLADAISSSMGGTSGILLEIMFRKMGTTLLNTTTTTTVTDSQGGDGDDGNDNDSGNGDDATTKKVVIDTKRMQEALAEGIQAVSFYGGASLGSRTMLDALYPALEAFQKYDSDDSGDGGSGDGSCCWESVMTAATRGAEGTATMTSANAGRSNYLSEDVLTGTPDPGAFAVSLVFKAVWEALR